MEYLAHDRALVARRDGVAVGFVQFCPSAAAGGVAVHRLCVDKSMHGNGVGTELLVRAQADEMVRHATTVRIDVWEHALTRDIVNRLSELPLCTDDLELKAEIERWMGVAGEWDEREIDQRMAGGATRSGL